jgi:protein required for attachment to host cells
VLDPSLQWDEYNCREEINMSKAIWIVVANQEVSRIFETNSPSGEIEEKTVGTHPTSRLKEKDLVSDSPGRTYDRVDGARRRTAPSESRHTHEIDSFAKEIASTLKAAVLQGQVGTLILIAPAAFLGTLRGKLDEATQQHVVLELGKDLVRVDAFEIRRHLPEFLPRH